MCRGEFLRLLLPYTMRSARPYPRERLGGRALEGVKIWSKPRNAIQFPIPPLPLVRAILKHSLTILADYLKAKTHNSKKLL